jgi:hypothetical protein
MISNGTLAQRISAALGIFLVLVAVIGLIVNPDFGTGSDLTAKVFLVDWNGWHAVSSILLGATALVAAARPAWALVFLPACGIANAVESLWALLDTTPLGLLYFPHVSTDIALHLVITVVSLVAFFVQWSRNRRGIPATAV